MSAVLSFRLYPFGSGAHTLDPITTFYHFNKASSNSSNNGSATSFEILLKQIFIKKKKKIMTKEKLN